MRAPAGSVRLKEAAAHLRDVDVVLLQEVDGGASPDAARSLAELLGMTVAAHAATWTYSSGSTSGAAILTRLPVLSGFAVDIHHGRMQRAAGAWLLTAAQRPFLLISAHLEWGGAAESLRLEQARAINAVVEAELTRCPVEGTAPIAVWGGDFNTTPDADMLRYLRGQGVFEGESTYWIDVWREFSSGAGYTNVPAENALAVRTALEVGIEDPGMLPPRRIDYLLVRGWAWGRPGCPLSVELRGQQDLTGAGPASDHYAVVATLWDPPS